ncbi:MAG: hypothetical protein IJD51_01210 [Clostridia bacterium]|nr:hypothetical protein [Clostridia bacterium]
MADNNKMMQANEAYETLCLALDSRGWTYTKDEEGLEVKAEVIGNDIDITLRIKVDPERLLVSLFSDLSYTVPEDSRVEVAVALAMINYATVDGNFDYNFSTGRIIFRLTSRFRESLVGTELFNYMIGVSCSTIDAYNDKLFMIGKGRYTLEELKAFIDE